MNSKLGSLEEKVKLPATETISRFYQPKANRKVIRILTVAVYVFCVSLAAIMLSLYYIFIWDPSIRPFAAKVNNCDKIVIPEQIAIRLINSSEISAQQFYKNLLEQYRQIYKQQQLQEQRRLHQQHHHHQHHHEDHHKGQSARKIQKNAYSTATIPKINDANTRNQSNNNNSVYILAPSTPSPPSPLSPELKLESSLDPIVVPHIKQPRKHQAYTPYKHHQKEAIAAAGDTKASGSGHGRPPSVPLSLKDRHLTPPVAFTSKKSLTPSGHYTPTAPPINENPINIDDEDYSDDDDMDYDGDLTQEGESSGFFPPTYEYVNRKKLNLD